MSNLALISSRESQSFSGFSENKSWSEKSWKERRKGRICGIPFTWLCIAAALFLFLCAVLGGGLGGYAAGKSSGQNSNSSNSINSNSTPSVVTVVSFYDASPIATPTSGAPPTGTFALTLSTPQEVQADCLINKSQSAAWDCDLMPNAALAMNVTIQNGSLGAELFYASDNNYLYYGAQTPSMSTQFAQFLTVQDNDNTSFGPAFYFQETYNKVVVVPDNAFDPVTRRFKRDASFNNNKSPITPGDKPWFCVWNNTFVEAFIYINQKPAPSSTTSNTTGSTQSSTAVSSSVTTTTTSTSATYRPGGFGPQSGTDPNSHTDSVHKPQASGNGNGSNERKRQTQQDPWSSFQQYPNVIKLEERRAPNSSQTAPPYCQQYQILWNFEANILNDYRLWLDESDPGWVAYQSAGIAGQTRRGEPTINGACHCQWMSGQGS